jgi:hypothetical protein
LCCSRPPRLVVHDHPNFLTTTSVRLVLTLPFFHCEVFTCVRALKEETCGAIELAYASRQCCVFHPSTPFSALIVEIARSLSNSLPPDYHSPTSRPPPPPLSAPTNRTTMKGTAGGRIRIRRARITRGEAALFGLAVVLSAFPQLPASIAYTQMIRDTSETKTREGYYLPNHPRARSPSRYSVPKAPPFDSSYSRRNALTYP